MIKDFFKVCLDLNPCCVSSFVRYSFQMQQFSSQRVSSVYTSNVTCSSGWIKYLNAVKHEQCSFSFIYEEWKKVWWMTFIEFNFIAIIKIWKVYVLRSSIKKDDCVKRFKQLKSANIGNNAQHSFSNAQFYQRRLKPNIYLSRNSKWTSMQHQREQKNG